MRATVRATKAVATRSFWVVADSPITSGADRRKAPATHEDVVDAPRLRDARKIASAVASPAVHCPRNMKWSDPKIASSQAVMISAPADR